MSPTKQPANLHRHPMFRAMVVMGNGLAVGCGGVATGERAHADNGNAKDAGSSGSSSMGAGGISGNGGGGVTGAPPPCPAAQYECLNLECGVNAGGWSLANCACNEMRPRSAADCAAGLVFVCRKGTSTADGHALPSVVPFECSCIPAPQVCGAACGTAFGFSQMWCERPSANSILCGCAYVGLK